VHQVDAGQSQRPLRCTVPLAPPVAPTKVTLALPVEPFVVNDPLVASHDFTRLCPGVSSTNEFAPIDLLMVEVPACWATMMMVHWLVLDPLSLP